MDKVNCLVCGGEFNDLKTLHEHIKLHSLNVKGYYLKYYNKVDLFDGDPISYKTPEDYLITNFNNRDNFQKWFEQQPFQVRKEYCRKSILERKNHKKLVWTPTQVELRTCLIPAVNHCDKYFGSYYEFCESIGLCNKHRSFSKEDCFTNVFPAEGYDILIDTREQKPFIFPETPIRKIKLDFGDYTLSNPVLSNNIYIERKSLEDLIGTVTSGLERFEREIERAREHNAHLVILVEETLNKSLKFNEMKYVSKHIKISPAYVFHSIRTLLQKYFHIQFLFVNGRKEAVNKVLKIFSSSKLARQVDLQLCYDVGLL